jgi:hydrogenase maturation protein HypF
LLQEAGLLHHPGAAALRAAFAEGELPLLERAIAAGGLAPYGSSAGRLFDAVAALLSLVVVASHEAQAGLALQAAAARGPADAGAYPLPLMCPAAAGEPARLDWGPLLQALLADLAAERSPELCAARFHNGLVAGLAAAVASLAPPPGPGLAPGALWPVALAGGCFQNRLLLEGLIAALRARGLRPYWPEQLPAGDGGLAAGQILALRHDLSRPLACRHPIEDRRHGLGLFIG